MDPRVVSTQGSAHQRVRRSLVKYSLIYPRTYAQDARDLTARRSLEIVRRHQSMV